MNKLHYSLEALSDLDEILVYIRDELQNPAAAQNTVSRILDTIEKLWDFSNLGAVLSLSSITGVDSDYRYLVCGNYLAFYRVVGSNIYIDRILYGKRDYLRILFPDIPDEQQECRQGGTIGVRHLF